MKPNPLLIISVIFAASFSGRAISMASAAGKEHDKPQAASHAAAPAKETKEETHIASAESKPQTSPDAVKPELAAASRRPVIDPASLSGAEISSLLDAIRERSAQLDARETELAERARLLEVVEKRVEQKTAEMKTIKGDLESRLSYAESAVQNDLSRLAKMYESMKPSKAGEIFNAMDASFAAGFLTEMNSESAALILANMDTEKAYAASIIIAGRNAAVKQR